MCGKETNLFKAVIEGTELKVCNGCTKFGKIIKKIKPAVKEKKKKEIKEEEGPEIVQVIVHDYAKKVKLARETLRMKQEELAKKINEKESVIHKIETSHYEPNLKIAKKLELFLKIKIVEEQEIEKTNKPRKSSSDKGFTIGDIIKLK